MGVREMLGGYIAIGIMVLLIVFMAGFGLGQKIK